MTADGANSPTSGTSVGTLSSRGGTMLALSSSGAATGTLCGLFFADMTFAGDAARYLVLVAAVACGLLSLTRLRGMVWTTGAALVGLVLLIGFTPIVPLLMASPVIQDSLERTDAVVSLGGGVNTDGVLSANTRDRTLHSLVLLKQGYARELVLTGGETLGESLVRGQMWDLGLSYPVENAGPVVNTHDEALAVARLARQRGWHRVILVTNAWHMPRAAAVFEKAGLSVLRSPCQDSRCDMVHPSRLGDRIRVFDCWAHETVGTWVYHLRGWL